MEENDVSEQQTKNLIKKLQNQLNPENEQEDADNHKQANYAYRKNLTDLGGNNRESNLILSNSVANQQRLQMQQ